MAENVEKFTEPASTSDGGASLRDDADEKAKTLKRRSEGTPLVVPRRTGSFQDVMDAVRANPFHDPVMELFEWKDPIRSGLVLAIEVLSLLLLTWGGYSLISLLAYLFLFTFLLSFLLVQYSNFSGTPHIFKNRLGSVSDFVTRDQFVRHAETVYRVADALSLLARDAILFTDVAFSLKFAFGVIAASVLVSWFSPLTIVMVPFIFGFAWVRLYEQKKAQIDGLYFKIADLVQQKVGPLIAKLPLDKVKLKSD